MELGTASTMANETELLKALRTELLRAHGKVLSTECAMENEKARLTESTRERVMVLEKAPLTAIWRASVKEPLTEQMREPEKAL